MSGVLESLMKRWFYGLPLTLGHERAGVVADLGKGVEHVAIGDAVAVYGAWGCGYCHNCSQGKENYCINAAALGIKPPGIGSPGAMAEYMIVDSPRHLVPLGDLDPVKNVSLTDAGLTPHHAVKSTIHTLGAGSTAVVIGAGGLGHVGIQILRALTGATVIALDVNEERLALARRVGAHHTILSNNNAVGAIKDLTSGLGANAIFDFVGEQPTVEIAGAAAAVEAEIRIVGIGGGALGVGIATTARDVGVRAPYWGSRSELIEVLDLARSGSIGVEIETFSLDEAPGHMNSCAGGRFADARLSCRIDLPGPSAIPTWTQHSLAKSDPPVTDPSACPIRRRAYMMQQP
jgi:propanol-preferring alcohol dehydrogenase